MTAEATKYPISKIHKETIKIFIIYLHVPVYVSVSVHCLRLETSPETGIRSSCELLDVGHWELNPALLKEQCMFLTTEPPLEPPNYFRRC